jgi:alkanesulfonate monooxygenase SsuD/methylene tetrahydromethanopterin reductase-like flavin-dependent oxidoreductase (luciferase family)
MTMDLDIILEADLTPAQIQELSLLAEKFGFRGIWAQNYARARDAFMTLVPAAQATRNIKIGVVIVSPYEMHPLKIANAVLTLNEFADGRAMVVVGAGGEWPLVMNSQVFDMGYGKRIAGTREALEIIKASIDQEVVNYQGEIYNAQGFTTQWHHGEPPLIYDGASGPKMLKMATGVADGIMMSDMHPEMLGDRMSLIRHSLAENGRNDEKFHISNFIAWHIKKDREASLEEARRELIIRGWLERDWLEPYVKPEEAEAILANKWPFLKAYRERHGNIEGVPAHVVDALVEGLSLAGDASEIDRHIDRLQTLSSAGFTEIALRIHDDPADSIRMIGKKVLPALL